MARFPAQVRRKWLAAAVPCLVAAAAAGLGPLSKAQELDNKNASRLLVNQVKPEYPAVARVNYIHGQVQMELTVAPDGHVRRAHVLRGHPLLAASALRAIRRWVYRPFVTAAGPTAFSTQVSVHFDLRETNVEQIPSEPERDLARQIKPPQILEKTPAPPDSRSIRLRVLVSEEGQVIDSTLLSGPVGLTGAADASVTRWKFQPARWGSLTVPWYLDVDVPVGTGVTPETPAVADPP